MPLAQSLKNHRRVVVQPGATIADGLKPVQIGEANFAIAKEHVTTAHEVDDTSIGKAMSALLRHAKIVVEPSGAAAMAVALSDMLPTKARRVGVILSGGNISLTDVASAINRYNEA